LEEALAELRRGVEIRLEGLTKAYGKIRAADNVSLFVEGGQFVTLLGPSGSGKTTTLMMVAGFVEPDEGDVFIGGVRVTETPAHRRGIGMVFQHYALFPHMTIFDNIAYPLRIRRVPRKEIRQRVAEALETVQLPDVGSRHPRMLSGGQQQRIAVARALVYKPSVLLMDEPLGALDRKLREQMQIELRNLQQRLGITTLYVTHDQEEAMALSDYIVVMQKGSIEQVGQPDELYEIPKTNFVANFIGESNYLDGQLIVDNGSWFFTSESGLRLPVKKPKENMPQGGARFIIRPERVRWTDAEPMDVCIPGIITAVTYLGDRIRYIIRIDEFSTIVAIQPNIQSLRRYSANESVQIGWNYSDVTIL
jgi:spermidine/putrescine ABC transporter ATP-binding subunit